MRKRFQCEKDFSIRIGPTGIFSIQNHRNSLGIHWNLLENRVDFLEFNQIQCNSRSDGSNQSMEGGKSFPPKSFFNWAGQINQWPEQKSMKSFSTKIFFYFGRPNQSINAELFRAGRYSAWHAPEPSHSIGQCVGGG